MRAVNFPFGDILKGRRAEHNAKNVCSKASALGPSVPARGRGRGRGRVPNLYRTDASRGSDYSENKQSMFYISQIWQ